MKTPAQIEFESRKQDHIRLALSEDNQATGLTGFDAIHLIHDALPELDFNEISLCSERFDQPCPTPFLVSSMTAGHPGAMEINYALAEAAALHGWIMGVGSQRRELFDDQAANEWKALRKHIPSVDLLSNLGLAQLISTPLPAVLKLAEALDAKAMIIHSNPLQEVIQPEGTPSFKGGFAALKALCQASPIPIVFKETGCGIGPATLMRLADTGIAAVDLSGLGGTHWGRIEGARTPSLQGKTAATTFKSWGIPTAKALLEARSLSLPFEIWASGGLQNGLDAAKAIALGARTVGFAKQLLAAAQSGPSAVDNAMSLIEHELKIALFCTGSADLAALQENKWWF